MCACKLVRKFVVLPNSQQLRASLAWLNWSFRNTFPRADLGSGSPEQCHHHLPADRNNSRQLSWAAYRASTIYLSEQPSHPQMTSELLKTRVIRGEHGLRWLAWRFHTPLLPAVWVAVVTWKGLFSPWFLGAPGTLTPFPSLSWPQCRQGAAVPDLLGRDLLQLVALGPLQKCFACFSRSLGPCAPGALLFTHPSACIGISFFK